MRTRLSGVPIVYHYVLILAAMFAPIMLTGCPAPEDAAQFSIDINGGSGEGEPDGPGGGVVAGETVEDDPDGDDGPNGGSPDPVDGELPPGADGDDDSGGGDVPGGAPTPPDSVVVTRNDTPLVIELKAEGGGDDGLLFEIVRAPDVGSLSAPEMTGPQTANVTYTPQAGHTGETSFSYVAIDGQVRSVAADVTIYVYPVIEFGVEPLDGPRELTVQAFAYAPNGESLPEALYTWSLDETEVSGTLQTHSEILATFRAGGAHLIRLTLTLGAAAPIGCSYGPDQSDRAVVTVWPMIAGRILDEEDQPVAGAQITTSDGATAVTNGSGAYSIEVPFDWSGSLFPTASGLEFVPAVWTVASLTNDVSDADFGANTATSNDPPDPTPLISGYVRLSNGQGLPGVQVTATGVASGVTNLTGYYEVEVTGGWSGALTPAKDGFRFVPTAREFHDVDRDLPGQGFSALEDGGGGPPPPGAPEITPAGPISLAVEQNSDSGDAPNHFTLRADDSDAAPNSLTWTVCTPATHGQAAVTSGSPSSSGAAVTIAYEPAGGYFGADVFEVCVQDAGGLSDRVTVNVAVTSGTPSATYFVDVNNPNASDSNPGSEVLPFKTIQKAANIVNAGDTVNIKPGLYKRAEGEANVLWLTRSGAAGARITFAAYGAGDVILDNSDADGNPAGGHVVYLDSRQSAVDFITLRGLTATKGHSGGIFVRGCSNTIVEWCAATYNEGDKGGIYLDYGGVDNIVQYCDVAYNWNGIKSGSNSLSYAHPMRTILQYNHAHHNRNPNNPGNSDGVQAGGEDFQIVRGNVIHDNSDDGIDVGGNHTIVEYNIVYNHTHPDPGDGSGIKAGTHAAAVLDPPGAFIIRHNIVFNNKNKGLDLSGNYRASANGEARPMPTIAYNNTILDSGHNCINGEALDLILRNNIAWAEGYHTSGFRGARVFGRDVEESVVNSNYNLLEDRHVHDDLNHPLTTQDTNSINTTGMTRYQIFVDPDNPGVVTDLHSPDFGKAPGLALRSNSPALDTGANVRSQFEALRNSMQSQGNQKWVDALNYVLSEMPTNAPFNGAGYDMGAVER